MIPESANSVDFGQMVDRIRRGDESGAADLYRAMSPGTRSWLAGAVEPQQMEDRLHDVVVAVLEAIHDGSLRQPERLMGFVRTVARRQAFAHIKGNVSQRRHLVPIVRQEFEAPVASSPEFVASAHEQARAIERVLRKLSARDRQILVRFYYRGESAESICSRMQLTATQFRLYKSRAVARCAELAEREPRVKRSGRSERRTA